MIATAAMLEALAPGELLVKIVRDGWTIPPDHAAIACANAELRGDPRPGEFHSKPLTDAQQRCVEGEP